MIVDDPSTIDQHSCQGDNSAFVRGDSVVTRNFIDRLADGPYLNSRTIYDFDLDNRILTVADYDCILPRQDLSIPAGSYSFKQINKDARHFRDGRVHHLDVIHPSFDVTAANGILEPNAHLLSQDGSISLEVNETILCSSQKPIVFASKYEVPLTGYTGINMLYVGAVQPSDYVEFNKRFGHVVPNNRVAKEIIVATRSTQMYTVRYFDGSKPCAFPTTYQAERSSMTDHFVRRWTMQVMLGSAMRAVYFALAVTALSSNPPMPSEFLGEE
jgi:hypothetical protein